jgi:glycerol uptake facilitator-like aquaporin
MYKTKQELIIYLEFIGSFLVTYLNWFTMISSLEAKHKNNWILSSALTNFYIHFILFMATSSFHFLQINPLTTFVLLIFKKIKFQKAKSIIYSQLWGIMAAFLISIVQTGTYQIHRINAKELEFYYIYEINPNPEGNRMKFSGRCILLFLLCFVNMFVQFISFSKCKENKVRFSLAIALYYLATIGTFKLRTMAAFNQMIFLPYAIISNIITLDYFVLYFIIPILGSLVGVLFLVSNFKSLMEHGDDKSMSVNYDMLEPKKLQMEI